MKPRDLEQPGSELHKHNLMWLLHGFVVAGGAEQVKTGFLEQVTVVLSAVGCPVIGCPVRLPSQPPRV